MVFRLFPEFFLSFSLYRNSRNFLIKKGSKVRKGKTQIPKRMKPFEYIILHFSWHQTSINHSYLNTFVVFTHVTNWNKLSRVSSTPSPFEKKVETLQIDDFHSLHHFCFSRILPLRHQTQNTKICFVKSFFFFGESKDKKFLCDEKNILLDRKAPWCLLEIYVRSNLFNCFQLFLNK